MSTQRRGVTGIVILLLCALLVAACGSGGTGGTGGTGGKVTLKIWDFSAEQVEFHKKVAAKYNEEHPDVTIEWRAITQDEYMKTLPLAFSSRQAPDIFYWSDGGPMAMSQLLSQGWIAPLTKDGKLPADVEKRWPAGSFINGINQSDGKTYGFPFSESLYWGPGYMFMNNQIFAQAGLDPAKPPKTWSELEAACAKVKAATKAECIAAPTKGRQFQRAWLAFAGGALTDLFFDYQKGRFALDDPKLLEAFAFLQKLNEQGFIAPGTNDQNFSRQQFAANQAAIYFDGTWMPSVWASQKFSSDKFSVAGHPNPDAGPTGALSSEYNGNKYWISSGSPNAAASWSFLEWMTKPEGYFVQEYYKAGFGTLAFADNAKLVSDPAVKQIMKIASEPGFRVTVPVPVLKCPDLAKSKAYLNATTKRPDAEYEAMIEALTGDKPLAPLAAAVVAERQKSFESTLQQEAASGLKVSKDCYTFPDWQYRASYGLDKYPH